MIKFNIVTIFLFTFLSCYSQLFGDDNAVWVYDYKGGHNLGVTKVAYDKDTLVNNRLIRIFKKTAYRESSSGVIEAPLPSLYIYDVDGVVQSSKDLVHFDTLYNFQTPVGSSWTFPERDYDGNLTGLQLERKVLNRFEILLNGEKVECLEVRNGNDIVLDTMCAGIGSRVFYIEPFDYIAVNADGGEGGVLRCFSNDELGVVKFEHPWVYYGGSYSSFEYECDQLSEITEAESASSTFDIYPNPVSDILHIKGEVENINQVEIYNLHGQLVLHKQSGGAFIEVDVAGISSGFYYVILNRKYFEKIAIHRN